MAKRKTAVQKEIEKDIKKLEEVEYGIKEFLHGALIGLVVGFIIGIIFLK